jgi:hypothetical protein
MNSVETMVRMGDCSRLVLSNKAIAAYHQDVLPRRQKEPTMIKWDRSPRQRNDGNKQLASEALVILHGARSLPPGEAVEALRPFLESMRTKGSGDRLADASLAAVTELTRSLKENHAATDDLWQNAIEATLSFANETQ